MMTSAVSYRSLVVGGAVLAGLACGSEPSTSPGTGADTGGSTGSLDGGLEDESTGSGASSGSGEPSSSGEPDGSDSTEEQPPAFECTLVIGYSQVNQWYTAGFEDVVDDAGWQLLWNSGAGVDRWSDPDFAGWDNEIVSPCASGAEGPDRVLLSVSGPFGDDEPAWASAIEATVSVIRDKVPSAQAIVLQPVVGGPEHEPCMSGNDMIRASWQHAHIDAAIAMVVGEDVTAGLSPEVETCDHYSDALGHLTPEGSMAAGASIGAYYAAQ